MSSKTDKSTQKILFRQLIKEYTKLINNLTSQNVEETIKNLYISHNFQRGQGIVCELLIDNITSLNKKLVFNKCNEYALFTYKLCKTSISFYKIIMYRIIYIIYDQVNNSKSFYNLSYFIVCLYQYTLLNDLFILQFLASLLGESYTTYSIDIVCDILPYTAYKLPKKAIHAIYERLRDLLQESKLLKYQEKMVLNLFKIRKKKLFWKYSIVATNEVKLHDNLIDSSLVDTIEWKKPDKHLLHLELDSFVYEEDYDLNDEKYRMIKVQLGFIANENEEKENEDNEHDKDNENEDSSAQEEEQDHGRIKKLKPQPTTAAVTEELTEELSSSANQSQSKFSFLLLYFLLLKISLKIDKFYIK